jgi:antitoxin VapB
MSVKTAKIFQHGRSQAVRLPKEFRLPGTEVRVRRVGRGLLLEPIDAPFDVKAWFAKLDEYLDEPFYARRSGAAPDAAAEENFRRMIFLDTNAVIAVLNNPISPVPQADGHDDRAGRRARAFLHRPV